MTIEDELKYASPSKEIEINEIRQMYTQSGMYRNDGSTTPLWTVDWYDRGVEILNDGEHLIRHGWWFRLLPNRTPDRDCLAVSFYHRNQLLKTYTTDDLVDEFDGLSQSASQYLWIKKQFRSSELEYFIQTEDGNEFVFDISTGKILYSYRPFHMARSKWLLIITGFIALIVGVSYARKRFILRQMLLG